ncbi:hypothetical protein SETIT_9G205500v2 [Setaria italica]|uniref:Pentatricopeptide repeat-containing protein n=1 Tax=Setaria italica TaxID=4555 RepID=K4ANG8_SETIT|nr:hypothetical protein SETIT_9G205500v2 [Setaria italica]
MRQQGLNPDVVSYGTVIDGLCKIGRVEPSAATWNDLIKGYCKDGSIENALALLTEACSKGS